MPTMLRAFPLLLGACSWPSRHGGDGEAGGSVLLTEERDIRKKGAQEGLQCHGALRRQWTQSAGKVTSPAPLTVGISQYLTFYAYGSWAS